MESVREAKREKSLKNGRMVMSTKEQITRLPPKVERCCSSFFFLKQFPTPFVLLQMLIIIFLLFLAGALRIFQYVFHCEASICERKEKIGNKATKNNQNISK
jgi:hypothetical protein